MSAADIIEYILEEWTKVAGMEGVPDRRWAELAAKAAHRWFQDQTEETDEWEE